MIALLLALAQAAPPAPSLGTPPSARECAIDFQAMALLIEDKRGRSKDDRIVLRMRDGLMSAALAEGAVAAADAPAFVAAVQGEAAGRLAAARAATDRSTDTEIDYDACAARSGVR